jgi:hypothetical protein
LRTKGRGYRQRKILQNRFGQKPWGVHLVKVKGDKVARALAAQATFSQELVYAPDRDGRKWLSTNSPISLRAATTT